LDLEYEDYFAIKHSTMKQFELMLMLFSHSICGRHLSKC